MRNFIPPPPSDEAKAFQAAMTEMANQIAKAKESWMSKLMSGIMPPKVFARSKFPQKARNKRNIQRWLIRNKVSWEDGLDRIVVRMGDDVIGEFRVRRSNGEIVCEGRIAKPESLS